MSVELVLEVLLLYPLVLTTDVGRGFWPIRISMEVRVNPGSLALHLPLIADMSLFG
jgi:hypothetical protein